MPPSSWQAEADALQAFVDRRRAALDGLPEKPGTFAVTFPACPSPSELARQDRRHLDFLSQALQRTREERRVAGPDAELPPLFPQPEPKPSLPYRAARWAWRRASDGLGDAVRTLRRRRARRLRPAAAETPELTVVIPTYNRGATLVRTLAAYERQVSDLSFEIVVVDDGSTDGSVERLAELRPQRFELKVLRQNNAGPAAARNRASRIARGALLFITGDDIEPADDLLLRHWQAHRSARDRQVAILGLTRWPADLPLTATMAHIDGVGAQQFNYGWLKAGRTYDFRHFYTSNISVDRDRLRAAGGFCERFPSAAFEDAELAYRLSLRGLRIVYHPEAVARHHHPYDAESFRRRQERCGAMAAVLKDLHPELAPLLGFHDLELSALARLRRPPADLDTEIVDDRRAASLRRHALDLDGAPDPGEIPETTHLFLKVYFHWAYLRGLARAESLRSADRIADTFLQAHLPVSDE